MEHNSKITEELDLQTELQDPLLSSLVFLTRYYGKPFSTQALTAGLPLVEGKLTPELFPRAARRGGLDSKIVKKTISEIPDLLLPCVLTLVDGRSCVLLSRTQTSAEVVWPELHENQDTVDLNALNEIYTGFAFLVRKRYQFDSRSQETLKTHHGHWFWSTMRLSIPIYRDALIAALFINLFAIASPLFVMNVYDRVVPNLAIDTLWVLAGGMAIILIFDFLLKELRAYILDIAAKKSDILLSAKIFEKVLGMNMSSRPHSVGAFAKNVQEFDSIREFITSATMAAIVDLPFALFFLTVIALIAGPVVFVPITIVTIMCTYAFYIKNRIRIEVEKGARLSAEKNAHLIETLGSIEALKLANAESQFQRKWENIIANMASWNMSLKKMSTSVSSVTGFLTQISTVLLIIVGVYQIIQGNISMGALIACVMLTGRALGPFSQVSILATRFNQTESALNSLDELMNLPGEKLDNYLHRPTLLGNISLKNISFQYPHSTKHVLDDISIDVQAGEKVGIIGRIGSGKSTIQKLLVGFYAPTEGTIRFDGVDMNQISPVDIRQQVGCVPQDINLFFGSIHDNIALGVPHVDEQRILRAARVAGVTTFTDVDPDGLDRQVGERGAYLSGGQRQAVALARALLFDPPVLILDEPSSHMDNQSEQILRQNIKGIISNKTLILITHKMSMLELVDRIVVVESGKVVIDGKKETVLQALREGRVRMPK